MRGNHPFPIYLASSAAHDLVFIFTSDLPLEDLAQQSQVVGCLVRSLARLAVFEPRR